MTEQNKPEETIVQQLAHSFDDYEKPLPEFQPWIAEPIEFGPKAAAEALELIKNRSFSGRHPELGRMQNCVFCGLRHRENDNGREKPCEQNFTKIEQTEQVAGQTKSTKPNFMIESEIPRKQSRIFYGANTVKGRRKNPRKRPQSPMTYYERILAAKDKKNEQENRTTAPPVQEV